MQLPLNSLGTVQRLCFLLFKNSNLERPPSLAKNNPNDSSGNQQLSQHMSEQPNQCEAEETDGTTGFQPVA